MKTQATLNGASIIARTPDAIYIRIPAELATPIKGGCACHFCAENPGHVARWDTLMVPANGPVRGHGHDFASHVHMPDPAFFRQAMAKKYGQKAA